MSDRPRETRLPRPVSTANLLRKPSAINLRQKSSVATLAPPNRGIITQPSTLSALSTGLKPTQVVPKSKLGVNRSALSLRQPPSTLSLRPSRPTTAILPNIGKGSTAVQAGSKIIRRVPSTNFKENFFAPPPPLPTITHNDRPRPSLTRKKSQALPTRRDHPGPITVVRPIKRESLDPFGPHGRPPSANDISKLKVEKSESTSQLRPVLNIKQGERNPQARSALFLLIDQSSLAYPQLSPRHNSRHTDKQFFVTSHITSGGIPAWSSHEEWAR